MAHRRHDRRGETLERVALHSYFTEIVALPISIRATLGLEAGLPVARRVSVRESASCAFAYLLDFLFLACFRVHLMIENPGVCPRRS